MRVHCHQCNDAVTPDLPDFRFDAYVLCLNCAEENAGRAECGEDGLVEADQAPVPYLANILGEIVVPSDPVHLDTLRDHAEVSLATWADEFRAALPVLRDAYGALTVTQRDGFAEMLRAFFRVRTAAHERMGNPYAAFDVGFRMNLLEPSGRYPGLYAGRGWRDAGPWLDLVDLATESWERGREFDPSQDQCVELLRRTATGGA